VNLGSIPSLPAMSTEKIPSNLYEPKREDVTEYFEVVKEALRINFGITDLTTAEQLSIRRDVEQVLKQNHELEIQGNTQAMDDHIMEPSVEAFWRFVLSYGIDVNSLPSYDTGKKMDKKLEEYITDKLREARFEDNKL
jgi:hypothetical protein